MGGTGSSRICGERIDFGGMFVASDHSENGLIRAILDNDGTNIELLVSTATRQELDAEHAVRFAGQDKSVTPLMAAAVRGRIEAVQILIGSKKCSVTAATESDGRTALMMAAEHGQIGVIQELFAAGASVNRKDKAGRTSLLISCASTEGHLCVEELLRLKAAPNTEDIHRVTPLIAASEKGHLNGVMALLGRVRKNQKRAKQAPVEEEASGAVAGANRETDHLFGAAEAPESLDEVVAAVQEGESEFVTVGPSIQITVDGAELSEDMKQVLTYEDNRAFIEDDMDEDEGNISDGVNVDAMNDKGSTALMVAVNKGHSAVVRALLNAGADLSLTTKDGRSAFLIAADNGNLEMLRMLHCHMGEYFTAAEVSAMVTAKHAKNRDALMDAILSKNLECVQFLLDDCGFPFTMSQKRGRHAACLAKNRSSFAIFRDLSSRVHIPPDLDLANLESS